MCADVKNFYLNTILDRPEYMKLALSLIPQEIIDQYGLAEKAKNGQVYIQINKGMYGLPQAGRLAKDLLVKRLAPRISPCPPHTWTLEARHPTSNIYPHCRRLWYQVRGKVACRPFTPGTEVGI
jgi:hypothetical protein